MKKRLFLILLILIMSAAAAAGCKDAVPDELPPEPTLKLNASSLTLGKYLYADIFAQTENIDGAPQFELSSDNVAYITPVSGGGVRVMAIAPGTVTLKAKAGGLEKTCEILVLSSDHVPTLAVNRSDIKLFKGQTLSITPEYSARGNALNAAYSFTSEDGAIASVSEGGLVSAAAEGQTRILVTSQFRGVTEGIYVDVTVLPEIYIVTDVYSATLYTPSPFDSFVSRQQIFATAYVYGEEAPSAVQLISADESIAVPDGNAVSAVAPGKTQIKAQYTHDGEDYYTIIDINVIPMPAIELILSETAADLYLEQGSPYANSVQLSAAFYVDGKLIPNLTVNWQSLDTFVAAVSQNGGLTPVSAGTAQVKAAVQYYGEIFENTADITVINPLFFGGDSRLPDKEGLVFWLKPGFALDYGTVVDLSGAVKTQPLIVFDVLPATNGVRDITNAYIKFTDTENAENFFVVRIQKRGVDGGVYASAGAKGQVISGRNNGNANDIRTNGMGAHTFTKDFDGSSLGKNGGSLYLAYDAEDKAVYFTDIYGVQKLIIDLDGDFPNNPWQGLTNGKVNVSVYADYSATGKRAGFFIHSILGQTPSAVNSSIILKSANP